MLQWNADGLAPKVSELELHLKRGNYDVCAIQETKLRKGRATPRVPGYTSIRLDRPNNTGGRGLLTYIRDSLVFECVRESVASSTKTSTIRVRTSKRKWVVISNVYCPPSRSHTSQTELRLDNLSTSDNILVLGDFNAHSDVWDGFQPQDSRGDVLFGWACERDLAIMNDGSHTKSYRSSPTPEPSSQPPSIPTTIHSPEPPNKYRLRGQKCPDVSICRRAWQNKHTWQTAEAIGSSDHLPIAITISDSVTDFPHFRPLQTRWSWVTSMPTTPYGTPEVTPSWTGLWSTTRGS